ncbi:response regulator [Jiella sp. M17.18]|uniref:response regulator n=1 Tax=Jiella sp. M17.18 TaxID=3234247 RepID=UPI0034E0398D
MQPPPSNPNLMIVEDEPMVALGLEALLKEHGYRVAGIAADLAEVLAILSRESVDIAIVDIHLAHGSDGVEVAEFLRRDHDIPSLFVSAAIGAADEARALAARPLGFIDKPYADTWLLGALGAANAMRREGVDI